MEPFALHRGAFRRAILCNDVRLAVKVYSEMEASGTKSPSLKDILEVKEMVMLQKMLLEASKHQSQGTAASPLPSPSLHRKLLKINSDSLFEAQVQRSYFGKTATQLLVSSYGELFGNVEKAAQAFNYYKMSSEHAKPSLDMYKAMLSLYSKSQQIIPAKALFQELLDEAAVSKESSSSNHPIVLDAHCFSIMVENYAAVGDMEGALGLFEFMMKKTDVPQRCGIYGVFHALIHASSATYTKKHRGHYLPFPSGHSPTSLLQLMSKYKCTPTHPTYSLLMSIYINREERAEAIKLFKKITTDPELNSMAKQTLPLYNTLMNVFADTGDVTNTLKMFDAMSSSLNLTPDGISYNILITAFRRAGMYDECEGVVERMRQSGVPVSSHHYNNLLSCAGKNVPKMMAAYQRYLKQGMVPCVWTFHKLIKTTSLALEGRAVRVNRQLYESLVGTGTGIEVDGEVQYNITPSMQIFESLFMSLTTTANSILHFQGLKKVPFKPTKDEPPFTMTDTINYAIFYFNECVKIHHQPTVGICTRMMSMYIVRDQLDAILKADAAAAATANDVDGEVKAASSSSSPPPCASMKSVMANYSAFFNSNLGVLPDKSTLNVILLHRSKYAPTFGSGLMDKEEKRMELKLIDGIYSSCNGSRELDEDVEARYSTRKALLMK